MARTIAVYFLIPILVLCSGEGNIHILEEEVAAALEACSHLDKSTLIEKVARQKRQVNKNQNSRIDADIKEDINPYNHIRRNTTQLPTTIDTNTTQIHVLNATDYDYIDYGAGDESEKFINSVPQPALSKDNRSGNFDIDIKNNNERMKRNEPLVNKNDVDQCLSQCVFINLQVVDSHGIPREAELWKKIQSAVTSQQSRVLLRDQTRACFQDLQSESENNDGCSYSNKLAHCLMLRFSDRKKNLTSS